MTHSSSELAGRIRRSIAHWLHSRMQEFVHCSACGNAVTPWESCCPSCGQADPSRVSWSVGAYLVLGLLFLSFALTSLISAF
jgi:hypothetical protein